MVYGSYFPRGMGQRGFSAENSAVGGSDQNLYMGKWEWMEILQERGVGSDKQLCENLQLETSIR